MLIDSNLLVYALNERSPKHAHAKQFLEEIHPHITLAFQNISETLRIITHPNFPNPFSSDDAVKAVSEIARVSRVIHQNMLTEKVFYRLVDKYAVAGVEIFDAVLVATAIGNEVVGIATDNVKHLGKYEEITVINPFS